MKAIINKSGDFTYWAELRTLEVPAGSYHLSVQSTYGGAKYPDAARSLFQVSNPAVSGGYRHKYREIPWMASYRLSGYETTKKPL